MLTNNVDIAERTLCKCINLYKENANQISAIIFNYWLITNLASSTTVKILWHTISANVSLPSAHVANKLDTFNNVNNLTSSLGVYMKLEITSG